VTSNSDSVPVGDVDGSLLIQTKARATVANTVTLAAEVHESDKPDADSNVFVSSQDASMEEGHHWTYEHPEEWAHSFPVCAGKGQSPINIKRKAALKVTPASGKYFKMRTSYPLMSGLSMVNNGHAVQVNVKGSVGFLEELQHDVPTARWELSQFHFHFPSEHKVNGRHAAGEMHLVHQKKGSTGTDDLAVVGVLLDVPKKPSQKPNDLFEHFGQAGGPANISVDLNDMLKDNFDKYFTYLGSLTTPPCSEIVKWVVLKKRVFVSQSAVDSFKKVFPNPMNNRPVQALNGRTVQYHRG